METRILLTESTFTQLCKTGFFSHRSERFGKTDFYLTKQDMKDLATGKIVVKEVSDEQVKLALQDIGSELIKEIIKRSPIYSEMANDL